MAEKKYVRMLRQQSGDAGTFHAGAIYEPNEKTAAALDRYVAKGFAERMSQKEVDALQASLKEAADDDGSAASGAGD